METRAKGGNLLLNVGPKPDGELSIEQEERLREMALWMFANSESIYGVHPWLVTNEGDFWFTGSKDGDTVYVFVKHVFRVTVQRPHHEAAQSSPSSSDEE